MKVKAIGGTKTNWDKISTCKVTDEMIGSGTSNASEVTAW